MSVLPGPEGSLSTPPPPLLHGDGLISRSVRFALIVMGPVTVAMTFGIAPWLLYLLLTGILAFGLDPGGPARLRLAWIGSAALVVILGAGFGTLLAGHHGLLIGAFALSGVVYALVESLSDRIAMGARFLCITLAIGAVYVPLTGLEALAALAATLYAAAISLAWDYAAGHLRPYDGAHLPTIAAKLRQTQRERWIFAGAVAITVPLAFVFAIATGLHRPYWTVFAIVIVLRADLAASSAMIRDMLIGTAIGTVIAFGYGIAVTSHWGLMAGMLVAALVRWPAQQLHGALGAAALACFILLLVELVSEAMGQPGTADVATRFIDVTVGCGFAMLALGLDALGRRLLPARLASR